MTDEGIYSLNPGAVLGVNGKPYELMSPGEFVEDLLKRTVAYCAGPTGMEGDRFTEAVPQFAWMFMGVATGLINYTWVDLSIQRTTDE